LKIEVKKKIDIFFDCRDDPWGTNAREASRLISIEKKISAARASCPLFTLVQSHSRRGCTRDEAGYCELRELHAVEM
jgi:hypothetical protein